MSIGSQQSACGVTTELAATEFVPAGLGSACTMGVALIEDTIIGRDPEPIAMSIGIVCAVHTSSR